MKKTYNFLKTLVVTLCLFSMSANAQIFSDVGTGTTYNDQYTYPAPYGNYYWFSRHQFYVSPAELIAAGVAPGASIKSIAFNIYAKNTQTTIAQWSTAIYTTTSTNPIASAMLLTGQVTTGGSPITTFNAAVGWNTHTLTPFIWNGTDGMVVETCHAHTTGYTTNASTYWVTNLTGTEIKSRWWYQDGITACQNSGNGPGTSTTNRPNIRFEWISPTPCNSVPAVNSAIGPTFQICPNSAANIGLANSYTLGGITYTWMSSTSSSVGPWTPVSGANSPLASTPNLTTTTYFTAVVSCSNVVGNMTATAVQVTVSPTTTNTVPYYEGFEGIVGDNKLPNCSWSASSLGTSCLTYTSSNVNNRVPRTGTKFASFYYTPVGTSYFYTNGIKLEAGVTYSAALWFATEYYGYNNWSDLSILYGPNQTTTGLVPIVSTNGPAISNIYKRLSNTFTVATTGLYYVAIKATTGSGSALYLSWDDLSITIPCTVGSPNAVSLGLSANTNTICMGDAVNLTATGANTYSWNTGDNTAAISPSPNSNTTYQVTGTNTLTGCSATTNQVVYVNPVPDVFIIPNKTTICSGESLNLTALGASNYTWSSGSNVNGSLNTVSPTSNTTYTLIGANAFGCSGVATQAIVVKTLPNVSANTSAPNTMCVGEKAVLTGIGATSYQWVSSSSSFILSGSSVTVSPNVTTIYTVTGTDVNGCQKSNTVTQNVDACVGLNELTTLVNGYNVYPNPTNGEFVLVSDKNSSKTIEVVDLTGKVVYATVSNDKKVKMNINTLANGIYYLKIQSDNKNVEVIKMVKQ